MARGTDQKMTILDVILNGWAKHARNIALSRNAEKWATIDLVHSDDEGRLGFDELQEQIYSD